MMLCHVSCPHMPVQRDMGSILTIYFGLPVTLAPSADNCPPLVYQHTSLNVKPASTGRGVDTQWADCCSGTDIPLSLNPPHPHNPLELTLINKEVIQKPLVVL